ncbi:MAG: helix-turn-helix domain-containing protein [Mucilaginibacter polytrichastri]|nr:helix-turn-helix domain-containing protein [Mucilaginibacter polytrichastri]
MKVLPFTIPVPHDRTLIILDETLPYFYTHLHRHEEIQLTWIISGEGTLVAGNTMHTFRSGDIFLLGPNVPHVFKSDAQYFHAENKKRVHTITIFFNPLGRLASMFDLPEMKGVQSFLRQYQNGFKVPNELVQDVASRISRIQDEEGIDQLTRFLLLLKTMSGFSDLEPLTVNPYPRVSDHEGVRIGSIYNFIIQNYGKSLTLEDVAEQAHMTPHAFCRYFKKHTRYTFVNFLNKVRINEACKMLISGMHNGIAAVAYSCGFNSITNFNRVFKSVTGKSPRVYIDGYNHSIN